MPSTAAAKGFMKGVSGSHDGILAKMGGVLRSPTSTKTTKQLQRSGMMRAGGVVGLGGVGMYRKRNGSRGGYASPSTQTARGSGRFA